MRYNFDKCTSCDVQGLAYDTTSVMQYATWAFSANGKPSMTKIGCPSCQLGQYNGLSASDITGLNALYGCGQTGTGTTCEDDPDYATYCGTWAGNGYCQHTYVAWMAENCKKSCGLCPAACEDSPDYAANCQSWANVGYCQHTYVDWMNKNCKKSCGCPAAGK